MLIALSPQAGSMTSAGARSSSAPERALLDAIRQGDERQASQVYASLLPAVQRTLLRVLGSPDRQHRELTQRSIERVIVELVSHPTPWECSLESWATVSAARVALDVLRARASRRDVKVSWGHAMRQLGAEDAAADGASSAIDRLRWLLAELPAEQSEAIVLCDVMGLDAHVAAMTSGVGVDLLRRRLFAGHERLSRRMALDVAS